MYFLPFVIIGAIIYAYFTSVSTFHAAVYAGATYRILHAAFVVVILVTHKLMGLDK